MELGVCDPGVLVEPDLGGAKKLVAETSEKLLGSAFGLRIDILHVKTLAIDVEHVLLARAHAEKVPAIHGCQPASSTSVRRRRFSVRGIL